jgi:two-component system LytT family response regulator
MSTKKLFIQHSTGVEFLPLQEILFCFSEDNWTTIILKGQQKCSVCQTLKKIETRIDSKNFFRVHRSYLVNLDHLEKALNNFESLYLEEGYVVPVSRRKKTILKNALKYSMNCV